MHARGLLVRHLLDLQVVVRRHPAESGGERGATGRHVLLGQRFPHETVLAGAIYGKVGGEMIALEAAREHVVPEGAAQARKAARVTLDKKCSNSHFARGAFLVACTASLLVERVAREEEERHLVKSYCPRYIRAVQPLHLVEAVVLARGKEDGADVVGA